MGLREHRQQSGIVLGIRLPKGARFWSPSRDSNELAIFLLEDEVDGRLRCCITTETRLGYELTNTSLLVTRHLQTTWGRKEDIS